MLNLPSCQPSMTHLIAPLYIKDRGLLQNCIKLPLAEGKEEIKLFIERKLGVKLLWELNGYS